MDKLEILELHPVEAPRSLALVPEDSQPKYWSAGMQLGSQPVQLEFGEFGPQSQAADLSV
jgi:hypothetical protein